MDAAADLLKTIDCMVLQFEIPLETVYYSVSFARKNGIRCIVNPAPAQPVDMNALAGLDYFVPNESEAETITGMPVRNVDEAKKCAEKLLSGGVKGSSSRLEQTAHCWPVAKAWSTLPHST